MIQTARAKINIYGIVLFKSVNDGARIVDGSIIQSDGNSTTIGKSPITEVPSGTLPEDATIEAARSVLSGLVLEGDLTNDEIAALLNVYPNWNDLQIGEWINTDDMIVYSNALYRVVQGHNKQVDWTPDETPALFTAAVPDNVIPVWVQPTGAHDAYNIGALVQWPEDGTVWRSTIDANTTEPGTLLPWGYWMEAE